MKKQFHICVTSHSEVLFRDEEDLLRGINSLALACIYNETKICCFSFQSDHVHFDVITEEPSKLVWSFRRIYTMYFNQKYKRTDRLGEHSFYRIEIQGPRHIEAAESYILRNAVHHGIASTPFGYPFNSSQCYYAKDLGHEYLNAIDFKNYKKGTFLPQNRRIPKHYLMNPQGMIDPKYFIEISLVEKFFGSPRGYNYCMTRLSGEEWEKSQEKDNNGIEPITLRSIEKTYSEKLESMYEHEKGRLSTHLSDIEVCTIIDKEYLRTFNCASYVQLTKDQKERIIKDLTRNKRVTKAQLFRCLAMSRLP